MTKSRVVDILSIFSSISEYIFLEQKLLAHPALRGITKFASNEALSHFMTQQSMKEYIRSPERMEWSVSVGRAKTTNLIHCIIFYGEKIF